ncbi:MAG: ribonuclease HII [Thermoplasmata archaeon]|nr:ribonuclease HII [Thermoplasmata archaeon]
MVPSLDNFGNSIPGSICGVDEAGRGPVIGPLVVCGLMVDDDSILREIGAKDSKRLTPKRREELAVKIKEVARYEYAIMDAEDIDVLRQRYTLNVIEAKLFASVIEKLGPCSTAYLDAADSNEEEFGRQVQRELGNAGKPIRIISKHGADDLYPVVSAASILAKTTRDSLVKKIEKELGRTIGSGYPSDQVTINFLKEWYSEHGEMPPHTRMSWKTVGRLINELSMTDLASFNEDD